MILGGKTDLVCIQGSVTARAYLGTILQPIVLRFAEAVGEGFTLMHDNARPHVATWRKTMKKHLTQETCPDQRSNLCLLTPAPQRYWVEICMGERFVSELVCLTWFNDHQCIKSEIWDTNPGLDTNFSLNIYHKTNLFVWNFVFYYSCSPVHLVIMHIIYWNTKLHKFQLPIEYDLQQWG